jgi:hypothetical protein
MGLYIIIDKDMMVLQNFGEMKVTSHDAEQAMNIKAEEVSATEEEAEDPMPITFQEIKAEPEVSRMSLYVYC